VDDGRKALERLGMIVDELDVSTATPEEASDAIRRNDYIYVTGGNTFYLLRELRRSGAGAMIVDAIKAGKPYIGESAGSVILAPSIEYVRHMDDPAVAEGLSDFTSLGAVTFYPLPHVGNFPFKKAAQTIIDEYSSTLELKAINNSQVILVSGDQVSVEKGAKLSKKSLGKGVMKFLSETSCMQRRIGKPPLE
jgi:dipeptidase E